MAREESICRLCGKWTKMSFEHIPPESAFNDRPLVLQTMRSFIKGHKHEKFRTALGSESLCIPCNTTTGGYYGNAYVEWARQGLEWLEHIQENDVEDFTFTIKPLSVLKQVCTMMIAMLPPGIIHRHQELREFVLNKESNRMPSGYGVYTYLTATSTPRFEAQQGIATAGKGDHTFVYAEVAFPPFGYCIVPGALLPPPEKIRQHRLYPIHWFWYYSYDEAASVELRLPKLPIGTHFALDYRNEEQVLRSAIEDELRASLSGLP